MGRTYAKINSAKKQNEERREAEKKEEKEDGVGEHRDCRMSC